MCCNKDNLKKKKNVLILLFCNSKNNMQRNFTTWSKSADLDPREQIFITKCYYLNQKNDYFLGGPTLRKGVQIRQPIQLSGRISGDIILFVSSKRKRLEARNFAVIFILILITIYWKTRFTEKAGRGFKSGFSGAKSSRDFREPWGPNPTWQRHCIVKKWSTHKQWYLHIYFYSCFQASWRAPKETADLTREAKEGGKR